MELKRKKDKGYNLSPCKEKRRSLRSCATPAEVALWRMLRKRQIRGLRFRRQFSIGPYILDFFCPEINLCIELDGQPHFTFDGAIRDYLRTKYLEFHHQIKVIRFENNIVFEYPEGVLTKIEETIDEICSNADGSRK